MKTLCKQKYNFNLHKSQIDRRISRISAWCSEKNGTKSTQIKQKQNISWGIQTDQIQNFHFGQLADYNSRTAVSRVSQYINENSHNKVIKQNDAQSDNSKKSSPSKRQIERSRDQKFFSNSNLQIEKMMLSSLPSSVIISQFDTNRCYPQKKNSKIFNSGRKSEISLSFIHESVKPLGLFNRDCNRPILSSRIIKSTQKTSLRIFISDKCKKRMKSLIAKQLKQNRRENLSNKVRTNLLKRVYDKSEFKIKE